jgi:hypothetical protein
MLNLKMMIYSPFGVESTIEWEDEQEYGLAKKFLTDIGVLCAESKDADGKTRNFFYMETMQQFDAFSDFRKSLRKLKISAKPSAARRAD